VIFGKLKTCEKKPLSLLTISLKAKINIIQKALENDRFQRARFLKDGVIGS
jgi:hypothetical protein